MTTDNLLRFNKQTPAEARANGRKGGLASGKARRERRQLRLVLTDLLTADATNVDDIEALEQMGVEATQGAAMLLAALRKALGGDIEAARFIRDTSGQGPQAALMVHVDDTGKLAEDDLRKLSDAELHALIAEAGAEAVPSVED